MASGTSARVASGLGGIALLPALPVKSVVMGFENHPVPDFAEAIAPIADAGVIPGVQQAADITYQSAQDATTFGHLQGDPVGVEGVACLMKYSAEDTAPPIYNDMNNKCYNRDRTLVKVYAKFLWLLVKTMQLMEPYPEPFVFRGVKVDLRSDYPMGRQFTWHSPTSCTKSIEVLSNPQFLGESGPRTIFIVKLTQNQAREITRYSLIPGEDEILLPPGCRFRVDSVLPQGDLTIVQIVEVPSAELLLDIGVSSASGPAPASEKGIEQSQRQPEVDDRIKKLILLVSGGYLGFQGEYTYCGDYNGKPFWQSEAGMLYSQAFIYHQDGTWCIHSKLGSTADGARCSPPDDGLVPPTGDWQRKKPKMFETDDTRISHM